MKTLKELAEKIEDRLSSSELYSGGIESSLTRSLKESAKNELEWILDDIEKVMIAGSEEIELLGKENMEEQKQLWKDFFGGK